MSLLATWAVSLFLVNLVQVVFGTQNLQFEAPFYVRGGVAVLGDFVVTWNRLFAIGFAALSLAGTWLLLRRTAFGLDVRAVTGNRDMAACVGIDTRRVDMLAFGLGSGLAGLALSPIYNVNPQMGATFVVVEHDMDFVERIADRVTVLHEGRTLFEGAMADARRDPRVIDVYLGR